MDKSAIGSLGWPEVVCHWIAISIEKLPEAVQLRAGGVDRISKDNPLDKLATSRGGQTALIVEVVLEVGPPHDLGHVDKGIKVGFNGVIFDVLEVSVQSL